MFKNKNKGKDTKISNFGISFFVLFFLYSFVFSTLVFTPKVLAVNYNDLISTSILKPQSNIEELMRNLNGETILTILDKQNTIIDSENTILKAGSLNSTILNTDLLAKTENIMSSLIENALAVTEKYPDESKAIISNAYTITLYSNIIIERTRGVNTGVLEQALIVKALNNMQTINIDNLFTLNEFNSGTVKNLTSVILAVQNIILTNDINKESLGSAMENAKAMKGEMAVLIDSVTNSVDKEKINKDEGNLIVTNAENISLNADLIYTKASNGGTTQSTTLTCGNISGFAWSDNIGWIDMCGVSYSTDEEKIKANGNKSDISGYAWSENVGWIQFGGLKGFPDGKDTKAEDSKIDFSWSEKKNANPLLGWARVLSLEGEVDSELIFNEDWADGWISLSGIDANGESYGPACDILHGDGYKGEEVSPTGICSGGAWGGNVLGWISFEKVLFESAAPAWVKITADGCFGAYCNFKASADEQTNLNIAWTSKNVDKCLITGDFSPELPEQGPNAGFTDTINKTPIGLYFYLHYKADCVSGQYGKVSNEVIVRVASGDCPTGEVFNAETSLCEVPSFCKNFTNGTVGELPAGMTQDNKGNCSCILPNNILDKDNGKCVFFRIPFFKEN